MATPHEIEILISPQGEVKVHVKGLKGPACVPAVQELAKQLGPIRGQEFTGEYYERAASQQQVKRAGT